MRRSIKNTMVILMIVLVAMLFLDLLYMKNIARPMVQTIKDSKTEELSTIYKIYFNEFGEEDFTCTGITYDSKDLSFWIADYGALKRDELPVPRLIEVSRDLKRILRVLTISAPSEKNVNLQGISYDDLNDTLWLAIGESILVINKDGNCLKKIELGKYAQYQANGIAIDPNKDTVWVLCYRKYLLNYSRDGELLKSINFDYQGQDHIAFSENGKLFATVGEDYQGENNYIIEIDIETGSVRVAYQLNESYAMEGICFVNNNMYIVNDGLYHDAKIKRSYLSVYSVGSPNM